jgi:hypothetical protein
MNTTATVETLTAEVRVLMVGNRQITLSVHRQLDHVRPYSIIPFGRVNVDWHPGVIELIGRRRYATDLVRSRMEAGMPQWMWNLPSGDDDAEGFNPIVQFHNQWDDIYAEMARLPLIVLAGLK